jgi:CubicO group peptidase (beta-lactamase class C family)
MTRTARRLWLLPLVLLASMLWTPGRAASLVQPPAQSGSVQDQASAITAIAQKAMAQYDLKAVILRVTVDGNDVVTMALGDSMTGVPATTDMHFRNGAVAISYVSTLLLELVDQGRVNLDDKLSNWLPDLSDADQVTLRQLANMTAGYADYVNTSSFGAEVLQDTFRQWTPDELIGVSTSQPHEYPPGTNWNYSHTDYVILGQALEKLTGQHMDELLQQYVLAPMGLTDTAGSDTAEIPEPVLHAFSSERRQALGIDPSTPFYEESTFWNPSWTITHGAIETTNIYDMTRTAEAVGEGTLLSPASHQLQITGLPDGFGSTLPGCTTCRTQTAAIRYGLGVWAVGPWLLQNPRFFGYAGIEAYLPSKKLAIAVANTYGEQSFDSAGEYKYGNPSSTIFEAIAAYLAPDEAPPSGE